MPPQDLPSASDPFGPAAARRLAQLRTLPVDTSRLDRLILSHIPRAAPPAASRRFPLAWHSLGPRPIAMAAAVLLLIGLTALLLGTSGEPVLASTEQMVQFHNDLVSGRIAAVQVDSMQAANKVLAAQWASSPRMPNVPNDHVMACCMRSVKNRKMACVLLRLDGQPGEPVTMTVANASDMKSPASPIISRNGIYYHVTAVGHLNMVMTRRDGRWICLIARLPVDRLMDLASSLQF